MNDMSRVVAAIGEQCSWTPGWVMGISSTVAPLRWMTSDFTPRASRSITLNLTG